LISVASRAVVTIAVAVSLLTGIGAANAESPTPPTVSTGAIAGGWGVGIDLQPNVIPGGSTQDPPVSVPVVVTRSDDCGPPQPGPNLTINDPECKTATSQCAGNPTTSPTGQPYTVISAETQNTAGTWIQGPITCTALTTPPTTIDQSAIHDTFVKLLPHPTIQTAPPNNHTLTNLETLIWLNTPQQINLGTTPLANHHITLIATITTITWNFGDHHTDTTTTPGRPFLPTDHCPTTTCPTWYGHTYTQTGTITLTATTTWTGRYNIDNGPYHPITGTTTTPPTTTQLTIQQSLSILVPNPTGTS
jgi:hypothetical protein